MSGRRQIPVVAEVFRRRRTMVDVRSRIWRRFAVATAVAAPVVAPVVVAVITAVFVAAAVLIPGCRLIFLVAFAVRVPALFVGVVTGAVSIAAATVMTDVPAAIAAPRRAAFVATEAGDHIAERR
jgi:hypothetical protein